MANSYQLSRPEHWDPLGRPGLENRLGEMEAALNALDTALNVAASRLDESINSVAAAREVVVGYYTGNGAEYQEIQLGFRPKAVLAEDPRGLRFSNGKYRGVLMVDGIPAERAAPSIVITATGFQACENTVDSNMNAPNYLYTYLAIK